MKWDRCKTIRLRPSRYVLLLFIAARILRLNGKNWIWLVNLSYWSGCRKSLGEFLTTQLQKKTVFFPPDILELAFHWRDNLFACRFRDRHQSKGFICRNPNVHMDKGYIYEALMSNFFHECNLPQIYGDSRNDWCLSGPLTELFAPAGVKYFPPNSITTF